LTQQNGSEATRPKYAPLVCPNCHSDNLGTIEDISGVALCSAYVDISNGDRSVEHDGWTDVCWDSSTSVGITCRDCMWESHSDNYMADLILDPESNAAQTELEVNDARSPEL